MNGAHFHLIVNHLPLGAFVFGILLVFLSLFLSNEGIIRSALILTLMGGVLSVPTYLSGEGAEHVVKKFDQSRVEMIEPHEEAAEKTIWVTAITGIVAAFGLWVSIKNGQIPRSFLIGISLLGLSSIFMLGLTSNLGGKISHPEIRGDAPAAANPNMPPSETESDND